MRGRAHALIAAAALFASCGSKTGLDLPDTGAVRDARVLDASRDAGRRRRCIEVPRDREPIEVDFEIDARLAVVDVMLLLDASASMDDEIDEIARRLGSRIVPGIEAIVPDAAFGVAVIGEFGVEPYGPPDVSPYELRVPITQDVVRVQGALDVLPRWGNYDEPESQTEGLYQLATGEGLTGWIRPAPACPSGGDGGACFRREAQPVVLLITDAPFHEGPDRSEPYVGIVPRPHRWDETVAALNASSFRVIGLGASDFDRRSPMPDLRAIAQATGTVGPDGPVALDIGGDGTGLGDRVVESVRRLAEGVPLDVEAIALDVGTDDIDATTLVSAIRAVSADPSDGVTSMDGARFVGARPGVRLRFALDVDGRSAPDAWLGLTIPLDVVFRGAGRTRLGSERVDLVLVEEGRPACPVNEP